MNILVLADQSAFIRLDALKPADIVISCGDFSETAVLEIATAVCAGATFAVKGNHDEAVTFPSGIQDLHLRRVVHQGIAFGGFQGSLKYGTDGPFLYEQEEVEAALADFPSVDVFVAHNSPRYIHDREDISHHGFEAFLDYIERAQPRLFLHGHQHTNIETYIERTLIIGVYRDRRVKADAPVSGRARWNGFGV